MLYREIVIKYVRKLDAQESIQISRSHSRCCHDLSLTIERDCRADVRQSQELELLKNPLEIAVPAETLAETARPRHTVFDHGFAPVVPFLDQPIADRKAVAPDS